MLGGNNDGEESSRGILIIPSAQYIWAADVINHGGAATVMSWFFADVTE